jgi:two-component system response regulator HydG
VTDADPRQRETICRALEGKGLEVFVTDNMYAALDRIERLKIDILIAPLKGDRIDGLKLLEAVYHQNPDVGVVFVTEPNVLETDIGIKAILHHEASFFLPEPLNPAHLNAFLHKILENQRLTLENRQLQSQIDEKVGLIQLTGHSPKIQEIRQITAQVAPTKATVIIRGERGTGKELVARAMHHRSLRQGQLVVFNCAALTESLAESELFGHERGAFTGAYQRRKGRFEAAHGGTLFLDEVGELSPSNQARLLRVIAEREFERIGGNETIQVDVRVICATNRDLEERVEGGKFMADLYDRLNVIQITLPPLRERKEDIPLLVKVFIEEFSRENRKAVKEMTRRALRALVKYDWPGNVRELRNCIEGMVVMSNRTELDLEDLSEHILQLAGMSPPLVFSAPTAADATSSELSPSHLNVKIGMSLAELEKEAIRATLKYAGNNKVKTAKILGISKRTIFRKIADATSSELSPSHLNVKIGMSLAELEKEAIRATLKYAGNNKVKTAKILGISKPTIFRKIKEYDLCDD